MAMERWGVILDAGSSGTRLHIYKWKDPAKARKHASPNQRKRLPKIKTKKAYSKKIRPGVSTFGDHPTHVGPEHLQGLLNHALSIIPEDKVEDTPVFLMATAGMRLLPQAQQAALTAEICSYFQQNTKFSLPDCGLHIQVIPGETEGLYGWLASNYLLGGFDHAEQHAHGRGHHTYGFLDMGGASAQIAFTPNVTEAEKHAKDLTLVRLRTLDGAPLEYKVFTATWLGFGVNQARESYVKNLQDALIEDVHELPDPCMPLGLKTTLTGQPLNNESTEQLALVGTGAFDECLRKTYPLLRKDAPCLDSPCLLNGQHAPAIDFDVNHFVGVSEYWHTTHGIFGFEGDKAYDSATYQKRVEGYCNQDWARVRANVVGPKHDAKEAQEACFKASWLISMLHDGIGIPRTHVARTPPPGLNVSKEALEVAKDSGSFDPFRPLDQVDDIEVSWTLGKMLLYAAGQIPPSEGGKDLPVGFGANVVGVPEDFQYAGSSWSPAKQIDEMEEDDDWGGTAEGILGKVKEKSISGVVFYMLAIVCLWYLFRKRERRLRIYGKLGSFFRRSRRPGSPHKHGRGLGGLTFKIFGGKRHSSAYDRVLEEGEGDQFELGNSADPDDANDHSDFSESSRHGRTSGLATPKVNAEYYETMQTGSALERSGLVVRTDSRERLSLILPHYNGGRRSRASSPSRLKSSLIRPVQED